MPPLENDDRRRLTGFIEVLIAGHGITWNVVELAWSQATASPEGRDIEAPAIVTQSDCTTCIPVGFTGRVDAYGNLILTYDTRAG